MHTLERFVATVGAGQPLVHRNLTLVPLSGGAHGRLDYRLAAEVLETGTLEVTEVSEGGSVPELRATSTDETMILLLDGEELIGAKQNRILNTSVLLPPKSTTRIPVSCVEQGRWRHVSPDFRPGGISPSRLRARKSRDVHFSLRACGRAESDQGAVWDEVAEELADLGATSPTMAMRDAVEQRRGAIGGYVEALPCPPEARGVFAAINDRFVAIDLFDQPDTLRRVWPRLVTGYAMDALARANRHDERTEPKGPQVILERVGQIPCTPCPSVGIGEDWRFETQNLIGQALVAEGVCVHLSVFPNMDLGRSARSDENGPRIQPPSRRRRRRRPPDGPPS